MPSLVWLDPADAGEPAIPFLNVRGTAIIALLGPPIGVATHFSNGRTRPHLDQSCPHCPLEIIQSFYAPALKLEGDRRLDRRLLCIPAGSAKRFCQPALIGYQLHLRRSNVDLLIERVGEPLKKTIHPFDVRAELHRFWFGCAPPPVRPERPEPAATLFDALEPRQILPFERPDPELPVRAPALQPGQRPAEGGAS